MAGGGFVFWGCKGRNKRWGGSGCCRCGYCYCLVSGLGQEKGVTLKQSRAIGAGQYHPPERPGVKISGGYPPFCSSLCKSTLPPFYRMPITLPVLPLDYRPQSGISGRGAQFNIGAGCRSRFVVSGHRGRYGGGGRFGPRRQLAAWGGRQVRVRAGRQKQRAGQRGRYQQHGQYNTANNGPNKSQNRPET